MRVCFLLVFTLCGTSVGAQWLNYPAPGIARLRDGTPNLSAPTPRGANGKPDLDGIWFVDETPLGTFGERPAALRVEIKPEDVVLTPEGQDRQRHGGNSRVSSPCLPLSLPGLSTAQPMKIVSSKNVVVILYEVMTLYRQIFMDGRPLPKEPNPAWMGYSVGKWDADTLVVDTTGFNDQDSILPGRRPHSDALHIIERFRRRDFGHLSIQFTIDDPKIYAKPWTVVANLHVTPDTELLEYICNENEKDVSHMQTSGR